jgi:hypothetical protein
MDFTLLDINISKPTDLNHRRKVAWLRSDRQIQLSEGVYAALPYYLLEGEVLSNAKKLAQRARELGYSTLIFGKRHEPQHKSTQWGISPFDALTKEGIELFLKLGFEGAIAELLQNRSYLTSPSERIRLKELLQQIPLPKIAGIYWDTSPIPPALLLSPLFRRWTVQELVTEEIRLFEEVFSQVPTLIANSKDVAVSPSGSRVIFAFSPLEGEPWEEHCPKKLRTGDGYQPLMILHNVGQLMMGEGLWPLQRDPTNPCSPSDYWGDCDLYGQLPMDDRLEKDWGTLGLEARLLLLKMHSAKGKGIHRLQFDAWSTQLRELELRFEENPLIRHFIADAWPILYELQGQPMPQGICQGGYWRGRPLHQDPYPDETPWFTDSRMFL